MFFMVLRGVIITLILLMAIYMLILEMLTVVLNIYY